MREQLIADFFLDPLGNGNHQDVVDIRRHDADYKMPAIIAIARYMLVKTDWLDAQ